MRSRPLPAAFVAVFVSTACLAHSVAAHAQVSPDANARARALQAEGLKSLDKGDGATALDRFQQAFALVPSPKIQFNMARSYELLGHDAEAFTAYERFLSGATNVPAQARADAQQSRDRLRGRLAFLSVSGPHGSELLLDGQSRGPLPIEGELPIAPGAHEVVLRREGRELHRQTVHARAGAATSVSVALQVETVVREPSGPAAPAAAPPAEAEAASIVRAQPSSPSASSSARWQRTGAWVAGAAALGSLTFAIVQHVRANDRYSSFNSVYAPLTSDHECSVPEPMAGGGDCPSLLAAGDDARMLANVAYVGAAVLGAGAATLWWLSRPTPSSAANDRGWSIACGFGAAVASCSGKF